MLDSTKLQEKLDKVERLANDKAAPAGEREAARTQAQKLRKQLGTKRIDEQRYKELVTEGKKLAKQQEDDLWRLGDIAVEVEGYGRLRQYAEEIDIDYRNLKKFKQAAEAFPEMGLRSPISIFAAVLLAAKSSTNKDEYLLDEKERKQEAKKGVSLRTAKKLIKDKRTQEPKPDKADRRAKRAAKKRGKDSVAHYTEAVRIIDNMYDKHGEVYKLVHAIDFATRVGQAAREQLVQAFQRLQARAEAEIAWLEAGDKLG